MRRTLVLATASIAFASAAAAGGDLSIANDSGLTLMEVYASPAGEAAWGEDLLHVHVLPHGASVVVMLPGDDEPCGIDLRFVFEDGRDRLETVEVCGEAGLRLLPRQP